jgi:molybdate transport system ATP-binding protein
VLVLERGRAVASGPVSALMSRPELTFLRDAIGLGSVFDAVVAERHAGRGLLELTFDGGTLLTPLHDVGVGATVRVRVPAREVILATHAPEGLSLHNVLTGAVSAIHAPAGGDHAVVQIAVGSLLLLAEVTRDAIDRLGIAAGARVHALVKSMSIELQGGGGRASIDGRSRP